jgi:hypothetical protein
LGRQIDPFRDEIFELVAGYLTRKVIPKGTLSPAKNPQQKGKQVQDSRNPRD